MRYSWSFVHRVLVALMVLGFGMAVLGIAGELLGWWNDVGQILITVGTIVGALAGTVELLSGASEATVETVQEDVGRVHRAVEANGDTLDGIERVLEEQTTVLEQIRDGT